MISIYRMKRVYNIICKFILFLLIIFLSITGCQKDENNGYKYQLPETTDDGWETASLSSVGINTGNIEALIDKINSDEYTDFHGIVLVKDKKLVFEEYFPGYNSSGVYKDYKRDTLHGIASCTKSITSCLTGIAYDKDLLQSLDQKMYEFFPEFTDLNLNERKRRITLKDMLTMRGGLTWDEWTYPYSDSRNSLQELWSSDNVFRYVFELPDIAEPGKEFLYNSGLPIAIGEIIRKVSGQDAEIFARETLFNALGIKDYSWIKRPDGTIQTGGGLALRLRDMAKFGQLYLNKGKWNGSQVVTENWIDQSFTNYTGSASIDNGRPNDGYGFYWWIQSWGFHGRTINSYFARGWGGQFIMVFPEINFIIVLTGGHYSGGTEQCYEMIGNHILQSVDSN